MFYIIYDDITGQWLSSYDKNSDKWLWDGYIRHGDNILEDFGYISHEGNNILEEFCDSGKFSSLESAQKAKDHLDKVFIANGDEVNFLIFSVKEKQVIKIETIAELKSVKLNK